MPLAQRLPAGGGFGEAVDHLPYLFDAGRRTEARDTDERSAQHRLADLGGHFGGSMDAVPSGLPEAPKTWHVCKFKTHDAKSFKTLQADGVAKAKPRHWAQLQVHMGLAGLDLARSVIEAEAPPPKLSEDPAW